MHKSHIYTHINTYNNNRNKNATNLYNRKEMRKERATQIPVVDQQR